MQHALLKYGNCDWMLLCDVDEYCFPPEKSMLPTLKKYKVILVLKLILHGLADLIICHQMLN